MIITLSGSSSGAAGVGAATAGKAKTRNANRATTKRIDIPPARPKAAGIIDLWHWNDRADLQVSPYPAPYILIDRREIPHDRDHDIRTLNRKRVARHDHSLRAQERARRRGRRRAGD